MNSKKPASFRRKVFYICALMSISYLGYIATLPPYDGSDPEDGDVLIAKVKSPDGKFLALVNETNGGATTAFGYLVSIRPSYKTPKTKEFCWAPLAKKVAYFYGPSSEVHVNWNTPDAVNIQYLDCNQIKDVLKEVSIDGQKIHVHLIPGISDDEERSYHLIYQDFARRHSLPTDYPYPDKSLKKAFEEFTSENYFPAPNFSPFLSHTAYLLNESWTPPRMTSQACCAIVATVLKNGTTENVRLSTPSGNSNFDVHALYAIDKAGKFSCLPFGSSDKLEVTCIMTYLPNEPELGACHKVQVNQVSSRLRR